MNRPVSIILAIGLVLCACSNELFVLVPDDEIPVVYFRLNPADKFHYLTLTRSFSGDGNAFDLARNEDEVYYAHADIRMEGWSGEYKVWETRFEPSDQVKDDGIFPTVPGYCFSAINTQPFFDNGWLPDRPDNGITSVRLAVDLHGKFGPIISQIQIVPMPIQMIPSRKNKTLDLYPSTGYYYMQFRIDPDVVKYCELFLIFRYQELSGTWLDRSINVPLREKMFILNDSASTYLYPEQFFNRIAVNIKPVNDTILRRFSSLDLIFYAGDVNFKEYTETYINAGNMDTPPMGNICNGYGLFTMVREIRIENMNLSSKTLDSLVRGQYTRKLGFIAW